MIAYGMADAARAVGTSEGVITEAVRSGELTARMIGRKPKLTARELERWVETLPPWTAE